jgi:hypothetical protein
LVCRETQWGERTIPPAFCRGRQLQRCSQKSVFRWGTPHAGCLKFAGSTFCELSLGDGAFYLTLQY